MSGAPQGERLRAALAGPVGGDLAALAAGALLPLGFAPFGAWPAALLSVAVLHLAWREPTPGRAAWRGWLFGLGAFGFGVSWIHESFRFSNAPASLALVLTAGFVAFLALYPAALGWVLRRLVSGSPPAARVAGFAAGWVLVEWLRGWLLTGFPWLQLGYTQVDGPLAALLPVVGIYGVGAVLAAAGALFAEAALGRDRVAAGAALAFAALALGGGAWAGTVEWTRDAGRPLHVALVQGNVPQAEKWLPRMRGPTLERYLALSRRHWDADLVVWPETAIPGEFHHMRGYINAVGAEAGGFGAALLVGAPFRDPESGRYLNSMALVGAGEGIYHKRHLVPFGEFLPLPSLLGPIVDALGVTVSDFTPGLARQAPIELHGRRIGVSICYEIAFGAEIREALPDAELLVTVSNDAWFGRSIGPHQHLEIARARALETGRWLLRATNTGISAVIDPRGAVRERAPQFEIATLTAEIRPRTGATPYVRWGDRPVIVVLVVGLALSALAARRARAGIRGQ